MRAWERKQTGQLKNELKKRNKGDLGESLHKLRAPELHEVPGLSWWPALNINNRSACTLWKSKQRKCGNLSKDVAFVTVWGEGKWPVHQCEWRGCGLGDPEVKDEWPLWVCKKGSWLVWGRLKEAWPVCRALQYAHFEQGKQNRSTSCSPQMRTLGQRHNTTKK